MTLNDMTVSDIPAGTVNLSTTLTPGTYGTEVGQGQPSLAKDEPSKVDKPETFRDALADEMKKAGDAEGEAKEKLAVKDEAKTPVVKDEAKPKVEAEPKPEADVKAEAAPKEAVKPDVEKTEGKQVDPPQRFMPKAKENWANTPNVVKAEVARLVSDHEAETAQLRESHQRYESVREFDEMARQHGTDLKTALTNYTGIERMLREDPARAVGTILGNLKGDPRAFASAISEVMRYAGTTPESYARHVLQNPQAHQPRQQAPIQQTDPRIAQLQQQVQDMQRQQVEAQLKDQVLTPFMKDHPRFEELQDDIALFLKSGKVPDNLSHAERLEHAYDLADRINPAPYRDAPSPSVPEAAPVNPDAGRKSVRGAPSDGLTPAATESDEPLSDWLRKELRKGRS